MTAEKVRITSDSAESFSDRTEAGRLLARELRFLRGRRPVVLGIPRGGIIVADEVARALDGELDIVLARKLGAPFNPELAIGSVSEDGKVFLDERPGSGLGVGERYIEEERERQMEVIRRRLQSYRAVRPKVPLRGRTVIVTDDGVATGETMKAALWAVRQEHPERLIAAIPVGSPDTVRSLAADADEMLCLRAPLFFAAVGQFYEDFRQVEDETVVDMLRETAGAERGVP